MRNVFEAASHNTLGRDNHVARIDGLYVRRILAHHRLTLGQIMHNGWQKRPAQFIGNDD